ncbi:MAG TPA: rod-binding protein [Treponemataceae bacterium]|nr:rod-binding protein [Treponemataceae bacterium]
MESINLAGRISGSTMATQAGLMAEDAKAKDMERRFGALVDGVRAGLDDTKGTSARVERETLSSSQVVNDPRLPGDFISSFKIEKPSVADYSAHPVGAAANAGQKGKIDKTSKLYEQALELESYFVKMMLSSMRNTVSKSELTGKNDFASKMYDDMLYDELARDMTKNAGFGLADQVYLQLSGQS